MWRVSTTPRERSGPCSLTVGQAAVVSYFRGHQPQSRVFLSTGSLLATTFEASVRVLPILRNFGPGFTPIT